MGPRSPPHPPPAAARCAVARLPIDFGYWLGNKPRRDGDTENSKTETDEHEQHEHEHEHGTALPDASGRAPPSDE